MYNNEILHFISMGIYENKFKNFDNVYCELLVIKVKRNVFFEPCSSRSLDFESTLH